MPSKNKPIKEFHISRQARDNYQFDQAIFAQSGNVIFANFHAARQFAQKINQKRNLVDFPEHAIKAGQINAMGLIDEILHMVITRYREQQNPQIMAQALSWLYNEIGQESVDKALLTFIEEFPPISVYRKEISSENYLQEIIDGTPHKQVVLEELLMLWIANMNPACAPFMELFDDSDLTKETEYTKIVTSLHDFFDTQPAFGPDNQNLIDMLRSPAIAVPHSLPGQLEFIRLRWGYFLGQFLYRLLSSLDLIKEEEKAVFLGPGVATAYDFRGLELEPERFSPDREWMPNLVLMAKNSYVWLDQLSKKYKQTISRLDQIPDQELDLLARWGFTGLWLIGLWERSPASKRIKQMRGNPEAVASAYSLLSYDIANDLGGEEAYQNLRQRAWHRGIRLASDMVPNHMGIDSKWVIEHPEWFISLDHSPFPAYSFNSPNLSSDDRVGIYLEDHYFDNTDAAVVFKRVDFWSGQEKFIYHGNDGTSMPWNDTAQLDFLNPSLREAVIQTILHVARKFQVIRFDAAMTLAKKHYQRLWYPEPGSGGDIPSRAEYGMPKGQFDTAMPHEFWREVVDRVAQAVPDTLLLAEAFWLMEGYFVRTLGMHRVYNSAFMNMLRDEKNQEYRLVIRNTLEFDPEILKRYVNFMNNPDERTAVEQFGKGDKYFGICTMLATMPGLPMFGHGQIEGFTEKYGMEYRQAYWDEHPDNYLVERHEREIFPLLRKRYLFAEAKDFLLYDFYTTDGYVNEDVFAYSNRADDERAVVIYHNKFGNTRGWIRNSVAYLEKQTQGENRILKQKTLGEGLGLHNEGNYYTIFRDHASNLEYIRNSNELHQQGLFIELEAYKYHILLDFREVQDDHWHRYAQLDEYLGGRGVPNIEEALKEIFLRPLHLPYSELVNAGQFKWLIENRLSGKVGERKDIQTTIDEVTLKVANLLQGVGELSNGRQDQQIIREQTKAEVVALLTLPSLEERLPISTARRKYRTALNYLTSSTLSGETLLDGDPFKWGTLLGWIFTHRLGQVVSVDEFAEISRSWIDEWLLGKIIAKALTDLGLDENQSWRSVGIIKLLISHQDWWKTQAEKKPTPYGLLQSWLSDLEIQRFLGINRYQDILWFNHEAYKEWLWWMFTVNTVYISAEEHPDDVLGKMFLSCYEMIKLLQQAEEESGFQVERLLKAAKDLT